MPSRWKLFTDFRWTSCHKRSRQLHECFWLVSLKRFRLWAKRWVSKLLSKHQDFTNRFFPRTCNHATITRMWQKRRKLKLTECWLWWIISQKQDSSHSLFTFSIKSDRGGSFFGHCIFSSRRWSDCIFDICLKHNEAKPKDISNYLTAVFLTHQLSYPSSKKCETFFRSGFSSESVCCLCLFYPCKLNIFYIFDCWSNRNLDSGMLWWIFFSILWHLNTKWLMVLQQI